MRACGKWDDVKTDFKSLAAKEESMELIRTTDSLSPKSITFIQFCMDDRASA